MRQKDLPVSHELQKEGASGEPQFIYSGDELDAMEEARRYHRWILSYFQPYLGQRILEVGAGTGAIASFLMEAAPYSELFLFEPAANLFPALAQRYRSDTRVRTFHTALNAGAASLAPDTVVMVNVLEHIGDDEGCLRDAYSCLSPGGYLLLLVPALQALYGALDRAFEHFRRYRRDEIERKLESAGFRTVEIRYFNFAGVAAWFFSSRILRRTTVPARDVRFYDRWIVPPLSWLERKWKPPVGQSVLAVAQKPAQG
ncbi:MAG TPA: class I SAM-dependent methyltransferase [Candidatus Acidoferrum sp.]|nr:class I SAM-dependent methyltransferase [Candidatus Acidoferrum sp.]